MPANQPAVAATITLTLTPQLTPGLAEATKQIDAWKVSTLKSIAEVNTAFSKIGTGVNLGNAKMALPQLVAPGSNVSPLAGSVAGMKTDAATMNQMYKQQVLEQKMFLAEQRNQALQNAAQVKADAMVQAAQIKADSAVQTAQIKAQQAQSLADQRSANAAKAAEQRAANKKLADEDQAARTEKLNAEKAFRQDLANISQTAIQTETSGLRQLNKERDVANKAQRDAANANMSAFKQAERDYAAAKNSAAAAQKELDKFAQSHKELGSAAGTAAGQVESGASRQKRAMDEVGQSYESAMRRHQQYMRDVANAGIIGGGAVTLASGISVKAAVDYQSTLTNIRNNTSMTDKQFQAMNATVLRMGRESPASLADIANAMMRVYNMGYQGAAGTNLLNVALQSAVSTGSSVADVTNTLASVMHAFGITAEKAMDPAVAAKYMNILHQIGVEGNIKLQDVASVMGQLGAYASALKIPLEDVGAAFAVMTRNGMTASQATTQVRDLMVHIIHPSKTARDEIVALTKATGVDLVGAFTQAFVAHHGLIGVMEKLKEATHGNINEMATIIPNLRGLLGEIILTGNGAADYTRIMHALQNSQTAGGVTAAAWARSQQTAGFQLGILRNKAQEMAITIGNALLPGVLKLADTLGGMTDTIADFAKHNEALVQGIAKWGGILLLAGIGIRVFEAVLRPIARTIDLVTAGFQKMVNFYSGDTVFKRAADAQQQVANKTREAAGATTTLGDVSTTTAGQVTGLTSKIDLETAALDRNVGALKAAGAQVAVYERQVAAENKVIQAQADLQATADRRMAARAALTPEQVAALRPGVTPAPGLLPVNATAEERAAAAARTTAAEEAAAKAAARSAALRGAAGFGATAAAGAGIGYGLTGSTDMAMMGAMLLPMIVPMLGLSMPVVLPIVIGAAVAAVAVHAGLFSLPSQPNALDPNYKTTKGGRAYYPDHIDPYDPNSPTKQDAFNLYAKSHPNSLPAERFREVAGYQPSPEIAQAAYAEALAKWKAHLEAMRQAALVYNKDHFGLSPDAFKAEIKLELQQREVEAVKEKTLGAFKNMEVGLGKRMLAEAGPDGQKYWLAFIKAQDPIAYAHIMRLRAELDTKITGDLKTFMDTFKGHGQYGGQIGTLISRSQGEKTADQVTIEHLQRQRVISSGDQILIAQLQAQIKQIDKLGYAPDKLKEVGLTASQANLIQQGGLQAYAREMSNIAKDFGFKAAKEFINGLKPDPEIIHNYAAQLTTGGAGPGTAPIKITVDSSHIDALRLKLQELQKQDIKLGMDHTAVDQALYALDHLDESHMKKDKKVTITVSNEDMVTKLNDLDSKLKTLEKEHKINFATSGAGTIVKQLDDLIKRLDAAKVSATATSASVVASFAGIGGGANHINRAATALSGLALEGAKLPAVGAHATHYGELTVTALHHAAASFDTAGKAYRDHTIVLKGALDVAGATVKGFTTATAGQMVKLAADAATHGTLFSTNFEKSVSSIVPKVKAHLDATSVALNAWGAMTGADMTKHGTNAGTGFSGGFSASAANIKAGVIAGLASSNAHLAGQMLTDMKDHGAKGADSLGAGFLSEKDKLKNDLVSALDAALKGVEEAIKKHKITIPFSFAMGGFGGGGWSGNPAALGSAFGIDPSGGFVNSGVEQGNVSMYQGLGIKYKGSLQDWDYGTPPGGSPVTLPGGKNTIYDFLRSLTIPGMGTADFFRTMNGGIVQTNHMQGAPSFAPGTLVPGGTMIGRSGEPTSSQFGSGWHLCIVTDAKGRQFLAALTDSQFQGAVANGGQIPAHEGQFAAAAAKYGVPEALLKGISMQESGGGMTWNKQLGVLAAAPGWATQIDAGAKYLAEMLRLAHGNVDKALAMYNLGPGGIGGPYDNRPGYGADYAKKVKGYAGYSGGFGGGFSTGLPSGGPVPKGWPGYVDPHYGETWKWSPPPQQGGYAGSGGQVGHWGWVPNAPAGSGITPTPLMGYGAGTSSILGLAAQVAPAYSTFGGAKAGLGDMSKEIPGLIDQLKNLPPAMKEQLTAGVKGLAGEWKGAVDTYNATIKTENATYADKVAGIHDKFATRFDAALTRYGIHADASTERYLARQADIYEKGGGNLRTATQSMDTALKGHATQIRDFLVNHASALGLAGKDWKESSKNLSAYLHTHETTVTAVLQAHPALMHQYLKEHPINLRSVLKGHAIDMGEAVDKLAQHFHISSAEAAALLQQTLKGLTAQEKAQLEALSKHHQGVLDKAHQDFIAAVNLVHDHMMALEKQMKSDFNRSAVFAGWQQAYSTNQDNALKGMALAMWRPNQISDILLPPLTDAMKRANRQAEKAGDADPFGRADQMKLYLDKLTHDYENSSRKLDGMNVALGMASLKIGAHMGSLDLLNQGFGLLEKHFSDHLFRDALQGHAAAVQKDTDALNSLILSQQRYAAFNDQLLARAALARGDLGAAGSGLGSTTSLLTNQSIAGALGGSGFGDLKGLATIQQAQTLIAAVQADFAAHLALVEGDLTGFQTAIGSITTYLSNQILSSMTLGQPILQGTWDQLNQLRDTTALANNVQAGQNLVIQANTGSLQDMASGLTTLSGTTMVEWERSIRSGGLAYDQSTQALQVSVRAQEAVTNAQNIESIVVGQLTGNASALNTGLSGLMTTASGKVDYFLSMIGRTGTQYAAQTGSLNTLIGDEIKAADNLGTLSQVASALGGILTQAQEAAATSFARTGSIGADSVSAYKAAVAEQTKAQADQAFATMDLSKKSGDLTGYYAALGNQIPFLENKLTNLGATVGVNSQEYKDASVALQQAKYEYEGLGLVIAQQGDVTKVSIDKQGQAQWALDRFTQSGLTPGEAAIVAFTGEIKTTTIDTKTLGDAQKTATQQVLDFGTAVAAGADALKNLPTIMAGLPAQLAAIFQAIPVVNINAGVVNVAGGAGAGAGTTTPSSAGGYTGFPGGGMGGPTLGPGYPGMLPNAGAAPSAGGGNPFISPQMAAFYAANGITPPFIPSQAAAFSAAAGTPSVTPSSTGPVGSSGGNWGYVGPSGPTYIPVTGGTEVIPPAYNYIPPSGSYPGSAAGDTLGNAAGNYNNPVSGTPETPATPSSATGPTGVSVSAAQLASINQQLADASALNQTSLLMSQGYAGTQLARRDRGFGVTAPTENVIDMANIGRQTSASLTGAADYWTRQAQAQIQTLQQQAAQQQAAQNATASAVTTGLTPPVNAFQTAVNQFGQIVNAQGALMQPGMPGYVPGMNAGPMGSANPPSIQGALGHLQAPFNPQAGPGEPGFNSGAKDAAGNPMWTGHMMPNGQIAYTRNAAPTQETPGTYQQMFSGKYSNMGGISLPLDQYGNPMVDSRTALGQALGGAGSFPGFSNPYSQMVTPPWQNMGVTSVAGLQPGASGLGPGFGNNQGYVPAPYIAQFQAGLAAAQAQQYTQFYNAGTFGTLTGAGEIPGNQPTIAGAGWYMDPQSGLFVPGPGASAIPSPAQTNWNARLMNMGAVGNVNAGQYGTSGGTYFTAPGAYVQMGQQTNGKFYGADPSTWPGVVRGPNGQLLDAATGTPLFGPSGMLNPAYAQGQQLGIVRTTYKPTNATWGWTGTGGFDPTINAGPGNQNLLGLFTQIGNMMPQTPASMAAWNAYMQATSGGAAGGGLPGGGYYGSGVPSTGGIGSVGGVPGTIGGYYPGGISGPPNTPFGLFDPQVASWINAMDKLITGITQPAGQIGTAFSAIISPATTLAGTLDTTATQTQTAANEWVDSFGIPIDFWKKQGTTPAFLGPPAPAPINPPAFLGPPATAPVPSSTTPVGMPGLPSLSTKAWLGGAWGSGGLGPPPLLMDKGIDGGFDPRMPYDPIPGWWKTHPGLGTTPPAFLGPPITPSNLGGGTGADPAWLRNFSREVNPGHLTDNQLMKLIEHMPQQLFSYITSAGGSSGGLLTYLESHRGSADDTIIGYLSQIAGTNAQIAQSNQMIADATTIEDLKSYTSQLFMAMKLNAERTGPPGSDYGHIYSNLGQASIAMGMSQ